MLAIVLCLLFVGLALAGGSSCLGKRQMVSMDGSLLNWLAALLMPLHATPRDIKACTLPT